MEIKCNLEDVAKLFKSGGEVDPWDFAKLFGLEENLVKSILGGLQRAYSRREANEICEDILDLMEKGAENRAKWLEMILEPFDLSAQLDFPTDYQRNGNVGNEYSLGVIRAFFILARSLEDDRVIADKLLDSIISLIFCRGNLIKRLNEALENDDCCGETVHGNFKDTLEKPITDFVFQHDTFINKQQSADVKFLIEQIKLRVPAAQKDYANTPKWRENVLPLCNKIICQIFYAQARQLSLSEKIKALCLLDQSQQKP
jgi:hypothetical protein